MCVCARAREGEKERKRESCSRPRFPTPASVKFAAILCRGFLAQHLRQNQSPCGAAVSLGVAQRMWHSPSHPSQSRIVAGSSPVPHTCLCASRDAVVACAVLRVPMVLPPPSTVTDTTEAQRNTHPVCSKSDFISHVGTKMLTCAKSSFERRDMHVHVHAHARSRTMHPCP